MMLSQYVPIFAQNEISGPVVLDLSLEDLDYLGISILAHRKILLKAIEDIRNNKRVTKDYIATNPAPSTIIRTSSNPNLSNNDNDNHTHMNNNNKFNQVKKKIIFCCFRSF